MFKNASLCYENAGCLNLGMREMLLSDQLILASGGGRDDKRTVTSQRRRRTTQPQQGERERAQAPQRRDREGGTGSGGSTGGSSGGGPAKGRSAIPGGKKPAWVSLIVIAFMVIYFLMGGELPTGTGDGDGAVAPGGGQSSQPTRQVGDSQPIAPVVGVTPFVRPTPGGEGQTWLVMLYQDADDKVLEYDIFLDLNEAERIGSTDRVHIVAQLDRYNGGFTGDGDWTTARRFYIEHDDDLNRIGSPMLMDLGEVNMADGETLVDFVVWAIQNYPADRHVLIMSDHGMGWPGGWNDPDPGGQGDPNIPLAARLGNQMYLHEIDAALGKIRQQTGLDQFEMIGMDACLMGHIEVFSALAPHARYGVASQEVEPALGWAYKGFLETLVQNPDMDGESLGNAIIDTYIRGDLRIVDDAARADFVRQSSGGGGGLSGLFGLFGGAAAAPSVPSASQLSNQLSQNITLTAVDLDALPELMDAFNAFIVSMQGINQSDIAQARGYAQSYTSIFGREVPASYIDLGHFVQLVQRTGGSRPLAEAGDQVLAALQKVVVAEVHGPKRPGSNGISIYFPNSQLYTNPVTGAQSYTAISERFAAESLWDEFLAFHYTGRTFEADSRAAVVPDTDGPTRAPGAGQIDVSAIRLSSDTAAPGQPITLAAEIDGENIGYVMLFVGFYDASANSIFIADNDYLEGLDTRELSGVYYPEWGEGEFTMEFVWEPIVFGIHDGVRTEVALFTPESYGRTFDEAVYSVDGLYTYSTGEQRYARLFFSDGTLRHVYGFTDEAGLGAPREIVPESGDTFTILERWLDLDATGRVEKTSNQVGATLTFGNQTFTWLELDAAPGSYVVGYTVMDLDGNRVDSFTQVIVE